MKIKSYIVFIFVICIFPSIFGQVKDTLTSNVRLSFNKSGADSLQLGLLVDTLRSTITNDTLGKKDLGYKLSKDALDDEVKYDARDSSRLEVEQKKIHLYGGALVEYQKIKLKANYMVIDFANNIIEGYDKKDSVSTETEKPSFSDKENTFTYKQLRYNFKTKKGFVNHAVSQQGEFNLVGSTTKFIAGETDSLGNKADDLIFNEDAIITTCTHDPPHYGIRAGKLKFVPNKLAVMSVANVEIAKVPTPIFLPFGFFPLAKGKSSGLIFPSGYEFNAQLGLGFREIGYYWPINNYIDMRVTGDIYTRGSWGVRVNTRYKKRYGYDGNITLGYSSTVLESDKDATSHPQVAYNISISHQQSQKAHPYRRLNGSINIQTNRYDQRVFENPRSALVNQYSSSFSFQHDMPGTPFRFTADFRHSQNTSTRIVDVVLPAVTMRMNTIYPFKKKNSTKEVWTDNIALSYNSELRNFVKTTDTTLFTYETLKNFQTGLKQNATLSTNFKVLKYFNLSPNINYEEAWMLKKYKLTFDKNAVKLDSLTKDTLGFEEPVGSFESDFTTYRSLNTGVSINTQIFGQLKGGRGFFRGIRHVMKPNISFNYKPENKSKYEAVVDTDVRSAYNNPLTYSVLSNGPFSLNGSEKQMSIGFGITNIIEAKYYSRKDTIEKKVRLFDNLSINGNYNFAADSFQWSNIFVSGNTNILKGLSNLNFRATYSPYQYDANDKITKQTVWENGKILPELRNMNGGILTSVSFDRIRAFFTGDKKVEKKKENTSNNEAKTSDPFSNTKPEEEKQEDIKDISLADWFGNFNFSHSINFQYQINKLRDTFYVSNHSIGINGSIPLTKNWNMTIGNISYDFKNNAFPYPYFGFSRDLHCWQMNFTWSPTNGVYSFFVGVKSSALSFLKYDYGQRNANTLFTGTR